MPLGTMIVAPAPLLWLASITAARRVQWLLAEWHVPLPGLSSTSSRVLLTLKVATAGAASAGRAPDTPRVSNIRLASTMAVIFFSIRSSCLGLITSQPYKYIGEFEPGRVGRKAGNA